MFIYFHIFSTITNVMIGYLLKADVNKLMFTILYWKLRGTRIESISRRFSPQSSTDVETVPLKSVYRYTNLPNGPTE